MHRASGAAVRVCVWLCNVMMTSHVRQVRSGVLCKVLSASETETEMMVDAGRHERVECTETHAAAE